MFSKIKLDGESIMAMMGSTSEKMYLCQVPNFGFKMIKLFKDLLDVGLLIEDPLTGHMPHHG
jgi:hypothetical protein